MSEIKFELSEHELEYLRKVHHAQALRELMQQPGWTILTELISDMIARLEDQHMQFSLKASRDAYWISGARLQAVREFATLLREGIYQRVDMLNHPLVPPEPKVNESELDGFMEQ